MSMTSNALKTVLHRMRAPIMMMIVAQVGLAGVNVLYKLAALDGMNLKILIAYRFLFAVPFMSPLAFFIERKSRPRLTWRIIFQAFLCGLFGFENLAIKSVSGIAKVLGTILSISGAMVLTFYKGFAINLWKKNIDIYNVRGLKNTTHPHNNDKDLVLGGLISLGGSLCYAFWFMIQAKMSEDYPAPYSSTALMCVMAALQATVFALIADHDWEHWRLGFDVRLLTGAYTGVVGSGLCVVILSWCVNLKGPLYVSSFSPLILILVAVAGTLGLDEKLHLGSVLGAGLIVAGLYAMLWGKAKEPTALKPDGGQTDVVNITEDKGDDSIKGSATVPHENKASSIEHESLNEEVVGGEIQQVY